MAKLPSKRKPILRIILLSLGGIVVLLIVVILASFALSTVFDGIDKTKFDVMNTESKEVYKELQTASGGVEEWTYEASCDAERSGDWPTGLYNCKTVSSTTVDAINAPQLASLHEKYYVIINSSKHLKPTSELDKERPGQFGASFVVSSAEKQYTLTNGGEECDYLAKLTQPYDISGSYSHSYGAPIVSGGRIIIGFTCTAVARGNWYE